MAMQNNLAAWLLIQGWVMGFVWKGWPAGIGAAFLAVLLEYSNPRLG